MTIWYQSLPFIPLHPGTSLWTAFHSVKYQSADAVVSLKSTEIIEVLCIDSIDKRTPSPNNCCFNRLQMIYILIIMFIRIWKEERSSTNFFPLYIGIMSLVRDELRDYLKPLFASMVDSIPLPLKHYTIILQKASITRIIQSH